jgi:hypothetical protein
VTITSGQANVVVRNGTLRGWGAGGIAGSAAVQCEAEGVRAIGNTGNGIQFGAGAHITGCRCDSNTLSGISTVTDSIVSGCICRLNGATGVTTNDHSIVAGSIVRGNTGAGLSLGAGNLVSSDIVGQNAVGVSAGSGLNAVDVVSRDNNSHGFFCFGGAYTNCVSTSNTGEGFSTDAAVITGCRSTGNGGSGFLSGNNSLVAHSVAIGNGAFGIHAGNGGYALANVCSGDCLTSTELREIKFDIRGRADSNALQTTNASLWGVGGSSGTLMIANSLSGGFVATFGGYQGPDIDPNNIATTCNPSGNYKGP